MPCVRTSSFPQPLASIQHLIPARQHATLPDLRPTRSGSNSKYNQRHQRVGRRDQGAPATTTGAGSASGAQPFPFANRAGCSDAADWQCNPAGAGRGFIRIVHFISQFPIPNSQFPIPNSLFPFPFFISRCPVSWTAPFHLPGPFHEPPHMYYCLLYTSDAADEV